MTNVCSICDAKLNNVFHDWNSNALQIKNYIKVLIKYICGKSVKYPLNIMACNIKVKPIMK